MTTDSIPATVAPATTVTPKVTVADRKALATASFVIGTDVPASAALFANVPNGREHLDATYNATVASLMSDPANHADPGAVLAPISTLRESIAAAMATLQPVKATREVDPIAVRSALIERLAVLESIRHHLADAVTWVADLATESDPGDITTDEQALIDLVVNVPEKVLVLTDKLANVVTSAPRKSTGDGSGTRATVVHTDPAIGTVLQAKGDPNKTCEVVSNGKGGVAYKVGTETFAGISTAATHLAGGSRNGWTYFDL